MIDLGPVIKWSGIEWWSENQSEKSLFMVQIVQYSNGQVMWHHLNTWYPYCLVFRWIQYSGVVFIWFLSFNSFPQCTCRGNPGRDLILFKNRFSEWSTITPFQYVIVVPVAVSFSNDKTFKFLWRHRWVWPQLFLTSVYYRRTRVGHMVNQF